MRETACMALDDRRDQPGAYPLQRSQQQRRYAGEHRKTTEKKPPVLVRKLIGVVHHSISHRNRSHRVDRGEGSQSLHWPKPAARANCVRSPVITKLVPATHGCNGGKSISEHSHARPEQHALAICIPLDGCGRIFCTHTQSTGRSNGSNCRGLCNQLSGQGEPTIVPQSQPGSQSSVDERSTGSSAHL
eukprot:COSAG02_NODE_6778_length_3366_cov_2.102847_1_plen_188_part_00